MAKPIHRVAAPGEVGETAGALDPFRLWMPETASPSESATQK
jgi:hypothetical protein